MFYVTHFFKIIRKSGMGGVGFWLITMLLLMTAGSRLAINEKIQQRLLQEESGAFFYALLPQNLDYVDIGRKVAVLPGIKKVETIEAERISKEVSGVLGDLKLSEGIGTDFAYVALKVLFTKEITGKTESLIQDYIVRLAGEDKAILGPIKRPLVKEDKVKKMIIGYWFILAVFFGGVLWLLLLVNFKKNLMEYSYIVEQFQRRSKIALKVMICGATLTTIASLGTLIVIAKYDWPAWFLANALLIAVMLLLTFKQRRWTSS